MRRASDRKFRIGSKGFTLIELLFVIAIIGLLSAIGTVSYESASRQSRDVKRVSDIKQVQTAIEIFFENHSYYPFDGAPGIDGSILETETGTLSLSDAGFSIQPSGRVYMLKIPKNPAPNGTPYLYRSIYRDGRDCNSRDSCDAYVLLFTLEGEMGALQPGPHAATPEGVAGAEGGYAGMGVEAAGEQLIGLEFAQYVVSEYAENAARSAAEFLDNETMATVTEVAVAPVAAGAAALNTGLTAHGTASGAYYIFYFLSQPFLLLGRRRRKQWGVVYNSLSKLPVDLAIVRLIDAGTGAILKSDVTDPEGRFSFLVSKGGKYRIDVVKKGVSYPSAVLAGAAQDGRYVDLYHGAEFEIGAEGAAVHPNIPVDTEERPETDEEIIKEDNRKRVSRQVALLSPGIGVFTLVISPSVAVVLLFAAQVVLYLLFRRLAATHRPRNWGVIYDDRKRKPVYQAVLRIFALPYHKLLETQVTDRQGRYSFRVGRSKYYLTVTKSGYLKTQSDPLDLTEAEEVTVIANDLPLRKADGTVAGEPGGSGGVDKV